MPRLVECKMLAPDANGNLVEVSDWVAVSPAVSEPPPQRSLRAAVPDILAAIRDIRAEAQQQFDALNALLVDLEDQIAWVTDAAAAAEEATPPLIHWDATDGNTDPAWIKRAAQIRDMVGVLPQGATYESQPGQYGEIVEQASGLYMIPAEPADDHAHVLIQKGAAVYVEEDAGGHLASVWARCDDDVLRDVSAAFAEKYAYNGGAGQLTLGLHEGAHADGSRLAHFTVESVEPALDGATSYRSTSMLPLPLRLLAQAGE